MKGKILLSSTLAGMLFFAGCGTSSSENNGGTNNTSSTTSTKTVSGAVVDGYIKGAKVCIDLNNNAQCDADEPSAATDENGKYTLSYKGDINGKTVIAYGGFDTDRQVDFNSTLENMIENGNANITPLTTFTYLYAKEKGISFDKAKEDVASVLGISTNDVTANPKTNDQLQKLSLKIQLIAETVAKLKNEKPLDVYKLVASSVSGSNNINDVLNKAFNDDNIKAAVETVMNQVDNVKNISDLEIIKDTIINTVSKAIQNNFLISKSVINNNIMINQSLNDLNLNKSEFDNKIKSLIAQIPANGDLKSASVDDVKSMVQVIRDTTYEFLDPNTDNQDANTSTMVGEIVSNYNNAINPAIKNLDSDINSSIDLIDKATRQFDKDLSNEFNTSVTDLNDRLEAISKVLDEHNETDEYNETTSFNDTISHTYSKDSNNYVTETFVLNGKTLTSKYYDTENDQLTGSYIASEPITLSKDGEYSISLNKLSFDGKSFTFDANGVVYDKDDNSKKIEISNATFNFNVDTSEFDNTLNKALAFNNVNLDITGNIITDNGIFNGEVIFKYDNKYIKGELDYSNYNGVKLNGLLTLNAHTKDLLKIANDDNLKYDNDYWMNKNLILVDGNLAVKKVEYNYNNNNDTVSHEENLTAINGETAHCTITDIYNDNIQNHTVNCDKNVTSIPIEDKIVKAKIDGKDVVLDYMDVSINNDTYEFYYNFDNSNGYGYHISPNTTNVNISDITVANPTNALDVSGDVKFSGNVTTPKATLSLNLTAQSDADGKFYHAIANDFSIKNNSNSASINLINITQKQPNEVEYPYYSNYVMNYDNNENNNITQVLLQGLNATLYDTNNNPISIKNANVLANVDNQKDYLYGNLSYLDFSMTGFVGYERINNLNNISLYMNIERNGYEPFLLGTNSEFDDNDYLAAKSVIKKGDYLLYVSQKYFTDNNTDHTVISAYDNNGVLVNVTKEGNNDANITITDKEGNSLATFDPKTKTVNYNDGSSETLY